MLLSFSSCYYNSFQYNGGFSSNFYFLYNKSIKLYLSLPILSVLELCFVLFFVFDYYSFILIILSLFSFKMVLLNFFKLLSSECY